MIFLRSQNGAIPRCGLPANGHLQPACEKFRLVTSGRCGKPGCRCHQPGQPVHGPHLRLTYKMDGKTVSESLPTPAAIHKAEREVTEFRKFQ
jgi:hypothetical protein